MICNLCIYEPMCWRLAVGAKPKKDCKDFKEETTYVRNMFKVYSQRGLH